MKDTLKQYVSLRTSLVSEKASLEARLREINQALGASAPAAAVASESAAASLAPAKRRGRPPKAVAKGAAVAAPSAAAAPGKRGRRAGRASNGGSLKDAAVAALQGGKSLSRQDLLKAVVDSGYKFTAKDPLNSLSTLIYSSKNLFKAKSGMISLA